MSSTAARRLLHSLRLQVRWGDMDALGHVNNAEYLRYFEQSRIAWLEGLGYPTTGKGTGPILAKASVTFLKPVVYPSEVEVRLYASHVGNSSFTLASEIVNGRDAAERFTEGEFVTVWVDYGASKSIPIPEKLRAVLTGGA
jgi:acyl-CoA thioester hydrolase